MATQTTRLNMTLPGNCSCWNCGAPLVRDTIQVRHQLAICYRCAEMYDHYEIHLPLLAENPELKDRTKTSYGIRCFIPRPGDSPHPQDIIFAHMKSQRGWK